MMKPGFLRALPVMMLIVICAHAQAAEWKIDPALRFRAGYNDNIQLRTRDKASSPELDFSPSARFSVETPRSGLSGDLRFDFRRFIDESDLNDNNVRLGINSFRRLEQAQLGLNLNIVKDTSLDSQLEQTGLVFNRVDRLQNSINPTWTWNFDPRTRLTLDYTYSDISYSNTSNTAFVDFTSQNGQLSLIRAITERTTATLTLGQTRTDSDNNVNSAFTFLQGGASYQFSETLSASLFAGTRRTKTEFDNSPQPVFAGPIFLGFFTVPGRSETSNTGSVFSASLSKQFERGQINVSASRTVANSVSGILTEVTRLSWDNGYNFSPILSGNLNLSLTRSQTTGGSSATTSLNRDYYRIEPRFNWDFARFWRISGSYRYSRQTFEDSGDDATQNAAYLTLTYRWPRIAVSR